MTRRARCCRRTAARRRARVLKHARCYKCVSGKVSPRCRGCCAGPERTAGSVLAQLRDAVLWAARCATAAPKPTSIPVDLLCFADSLPGSHYIICRDAAAAAAAKKAGGDIEAAPLLKEDLTVPVNGGRQGDTNGMRAGSSSDLKGQQGHALKRESI